MIPAPICPECRDGKHRNCDGSAWDEHQDEPTWCRCDQSDEHAANHLNTTEGA